ncbi:MAG: transcription termination factor Rho, partial [Lachnospiraceae bacterium]
MANEAMTREKYLALSVTALRDLAKEFGISGASRMRKEALADALLSVNGDRANAGPSEAGGATAAPERTNASAPTLSEGAGEKETEAVADAPADRRTESVAIRDVQQDRGDSARRPLRESGNNGRESGYNRSNGYGGRDNSVGNRDASAGGRESSSGGRDNRRDNARDNNRDANRNRSRENVQADRMGRYASALREGQGNRSENSGFREDRSPRPESRSESRYNVNPDEGVLIPDNRIARSEEAAAEVFERAAREGKYFEGPLELPEGSSLEGVEVEGRVSGILELLPDGYGFLRDRSFLPSEDDVYVSASQIHRFNLRTGDVVEGLKRGKIAGAKRGALVYVERVNGHRPDSQDRADKNGQKRPVFEQMTPIFPDKRIRLEREDGSTATRIVDLIAPIGRGQRGMIVSPPKAGKTTLLKDIAHSILYQDPEANLVILLIDERPEEVTDMKESVKGKNVRVVYSTFDETPEHHKRVAEMVLEYAKRVVEERKDIIILLDSITRLARACNVLVPPSGRTLSGGLDPTSLYMPKRFFGAARNMRGGGSLTILATALVDTGSKMDDVIYEEFKGTGNMELILDRKLQE